MNKETEGKIKEKKKKAQGREVRSEKKCMAKKLE